MESSTECLRRMLDERGVEWKAPASYDGSTKYDTIVDDYWLHEYDGRITVHGLTPEQAIAATVGRGTCELINAADDLGEGTSSCMCFECGYTALDDWWKDFNFCPNCGAKVVDE